jgi:hypothetical protein
MADDLIHPDDRPDPAARFRCHSAVVLSLDPPKFTL